MAQNQTLITLPDDTPWTELTNGDVTSITFQVLKGEIEVRVSDTSAPAGADRGFVYGRVEGERQIELAKLAFAGGTRLWARPNGRDAKVLVDHA